MLPTVDFDDQLLLHRDEVDDVATQRLLPEEFHATEMSVAQSTPEQFFSFGRMTAQLSSAAHGHAPMILPLAREAGSSRSADRRGARREAAGG